MILGTVVALAERMDGAIDSALALLGSDDTARVFAGSVVVSHDCNAEWLLLRSSLYAIDVGLDMSK